MYEVPRSASGLVYTRLKRCGACGGRGARARGRAFSEGIYATRMAFLGLHTLSLKAYHLPIQVRALRNFATKVLLFFHICKSFYYFPIFRIVYVKKKATRGRLFLEQIHR